MADHLPENALDMLACPRCRAFPLRTRKDGSLRCSVCSTVYPQRNGILDLRPPGYDTSGNYQGDPPEAARLRNQWDATHTRSSRGVQAAIEQIARRTFSGCRILDAGCGTGHIAKWIAERAAPEIQVWTSDVSEAMCQFAQENCEGLDQVTVLRAENASLPFQKRTFDVVFARLVWIGIESAHELLRPGGWFLESGLGDAEWQEINEVFGDRCITFPKDKKPKERLIQSGFVEAESHSWRSTQHYTLDEIVWVIRFAPILEDFDEEKDAPLLEVLRQRYGTPKGIALTCEATLLVGKKGT